MKRIIAQDRFERGEIRELFHQLHFIKVIESFGAFQFPVFTQSLKWPELNAKDICDVQPMNK